MATTQAGIPADIIRSVLLNLPVKALLKFECVCKEWCSLIRDSNFKHSYRGEERLIALSKSPGFSHPIKISLVDPLSHVCVLEQLGEFTEHLSFLKDKRYPRPHVLGCCNGLVLLSFNSHIFLWNPSTRHCSKVLQLLTDSVGGPKGSGFFYDSSTGDYNAIILLPRLVLVASLKKKEWRELSLPNNLRCGRHVLQFRNIFHFEAIDLQWGTDHFSRRYKILYFDPESEKFKPFPAPKVKDGVAQEISAFGVIEDCFSITIHNRCDNTTEILSMKKYGVAESWVSMFIISGSELPILYYDRVTFYSLKRKGLIWRCWRPPTMFVLDMETKERKTVLDGITRETIAGGLDTCLVVESLASPHEFIWIDDQHKHFAKEITLRGTSLQIIGRCGIAIGAISN
ncbi:unnamed protein product [Cuscuta europaea]|uniref:F-box domain-containing protein n=1 Tax=Cuscuta europaea TaxID=41803 RepID=A0A9P1E5Q6_CUSEU|nr:unnamed protein product [Cuscuta europaea]